MDYKKYIVEKLLPLIEGMTAEELYELIALPPNTEMGDFALPCFKLAKLLRKSPVVIAESLKDGLQADDVISEISAVNGYLNFKINKGDFVRSTLDKIRGEGDNYGSSTVGNGKTVCLDYSSINIAKPFHIGHLGTTVIGHSLKMLHQFQGYDCVGINYLGDWGTQFGKLIVAYTLWGNKEMVEKGGVDELVALYVRINNEIKAEEDASAAATPEGVKSSPLADASRAEDRLSP